MEPARARSLLARIACLLLLALAMPGCVRGEANVVLRADGSLDVSVSAAAPASRVRDIGAALDALAERLRKAGFETGTSAAGGQAVWTARRHYDRAELTKEAGADAFAADGEGFRLSVTRKRHLLYDRIAAEGAFQPNELLAGGHPLLESYDRLPAVVRRLAERQVDLRLKVTLPVPAAGHNGDASNGGRVIVWPVSLTKETPVSLTIVAPNRGTFVAAGLGLALVAAAGALLVRRMRKR